MIREHRWIAKALAQKSIAKLGLLSLYHRAQLVGGRLRNFHPRARIEYAGKLAADLGRAHLEGASVVEIGTGWVPVVPMGLALLGAREVLSFDLSRHLLPELAMRAVGLLPECLGELARRAGAPLDELTLRYARLGSCASWGELAERMAFRYHAPADVTQAAIPPASVDIVYSNLVLEHVTALSLDAILSHSMRILRPGGRCWHNIDYTDHYSHTHAGLSAINFLRYRETFWRAVGQNDILYLNRLRRSDYLAAFARAGFAVESVNDHYLDESELLAPRLLDERFAGYPSEDLRCGSSRVVLRKR
jgi:SAM-dependent methyltransferase